MVLFSLLRSMAWIPLLLQSASAQNHQPPIQDRYQSNSRDAGLIVGVSIGAILLLFLASVFYSRIASRRREARQERVERARADEELTITPLAAPPTTLTVAPPPYENPPSFEDAVKRTQTASVTGSQSREGQDGRDGAPS
ncbi:hypothetical protein BDM02DRAFT_1790051 [Thelephora ganbajun]|uniref:Uncharacterized protein n=1 Tax=Thelephora ganbajun TaxID=370292 RepID=A0ACB6ZJM1_THEGA|nr:hypothetical protein BDM02DRAFT_1790051 [Thelephora ganbajun]